ncbi:MMB_0454 family protein [Mycoplasma sp. 394]
MSNYINVPFNSDQIYVVKEGAFLDIIKFTMSDFKEIKVVGKPNLVFEENHTNLMIYLEIKVKETSRKSLNTLFKNISNQLKSAIKSLIDIKPKNIQLILKGFY